MKTGEYTHITLLGTTVVEETGGFDVSELRASVAASNPVKVKNLEDMTPHEMERYLEDQAFGDQS